MLDEENRERIFVVMCEFMMIVDVVFIGKQNLFFIILYLLYIYFSKKKKPTASPRGARPLAGQRLHGHTLLDVRRGPGPRIRVRWPDFATRGSGSGCGYGSSATTGDALCMFKCYV
jgi:hypothetical protein